MSKSPNQINIENMLNRMTETENRLGSKTVCTAKWLQSTIYLMNGHTHSCHHPSTHKIPISEIKRSSSALHNTEYKKEIRREMLGGEQPTECNYCWNIENLGKDNISDRTYKSADNNWSYPYLDRVIEAQDKGDVDPTYLEVAFDNTCNFKCMYCTPDISSKWMEEIEQHGPYSNGIGNLDWIKLNDKMPIPQREYNPYVEAFHDWFPKVKGSLTNFRITGGEPLLSKNMWRALDELIANPNPNLTLGINSNMDVPDNLIDKFIEYTHLLKGKVKEIELYTSAEAHGAQAEYIRYGMDYKRFMSNVEKYLTQTDNRIHFMVTFNALSVTSFTKFLEDIYNLRVKYNEDDSINRIPFMISYLRWPQFQDVRVLPKDIKDKFINEIITFMRQRDRNNSTNRAGRFYLEEIDQAERLKNFMETNPDNIDTLHSQFRSFYCEYDMRRDTSFVKTFPELKEFYIG
jgi:pyruvate-formate lyase-activating enzyme